MLAASQENMRRSLRGLTAMTERREIARELRTHRLEEMERVMVGCEIGLMDQIIPTVGGNVPYLVRLIRDPRGGWTYCREGNAEGIALVLATTQLYGIRAAQQTESTRSAVRTYLRTGKAEAEALTTLVREEMRVHGRTVGRVSVGCAVLDLVRGVMHLARWGACPVLHRVARDGAMVWLDREHRSASMPRDERIFTDTLLLGTDDVVLMFSESVLNALGPERQRFGSERLEAMVTQAEHQDAPTLADRIDQSLTAFTDGVPANADRTLFVVRRTAVTGS